MSLHKPELVGHAEVDLREGTRQDPAVRLLMHHVAAGDVVIGDVMRTVNTLKRYGVAITEEVMAQAIKEAIERKRPEPEPKPKLPDVVYYMRIGNRVKIGTSANLVERIKSINPEELMVTEPGGAKLERQRHSQFEALRTHGEWFELASPLTEHIEQLKADW